MGSWNEAAVEEPERPLEGSSDSGWWDVGDRGEGWGRSNISEAGRKDK